MNKKDWKVFRETGLVLIVNQFLHIFGWCICFEYEDEDIISVYPARTRFRGFDEEDTSEAYRKVSDFMLKNAKDLKKEADD